MKYVFIKEKITDSGKEFSAFTALTDALKSEGLFHLYKVAWYVIRKEGHFQIENIIIKKIMTDIFYERNAFIEYNSKKLKLNKSKYGK